MSDRDRNDRTDYDEARTDPNETTTGSHETTRTTQTTSTRSTTRDPDDDPDRGETMGAHRNPGERGKWISMLIALLGLWLLAEAIVLDVGDANFWNDVIIGAALVVLGGYNYYRRSDERFGSVSVGAFVALLGLWLLAAPFVLDPEGAAAMDAIPFWNDVIVGMLALVLGAYSAYEASRDTTAQAPART